MKKIFSFLAALFVAVTVSAGYFNPLESVLDAQDGADVSGNAYVVAIGKNAKNVYVQNPNYGNIGLLLFTSQVISCQVGDYISFSGKRATYKGQPEVSNATFTIKSSGNQLPKEQNISLAEYVANPLEYFAERVYVRGVTIAKYDNYNNPYVTNGADTVQCYGISLDKTAFPVGTLVNLHLVAAYYDGLQFVGTADGIVKAYNDYHITLYAPDCGGFTPAVIGAFSNWEENVVMTQGQDEEGQTIYTATVHAEEGSYFKFREANDTDWSNEIRILDGNGDFINNPDLLFTSDTNIVIDYSSGRYTNCPTTYVVRFYKYDENWNTVLLSAQVVEEGGSIVAPKWFGYEVTEWLDWYSDEYYSDLSGVTVTSDLYLVPNEYQREKIGDFYYDFNLEDSTAVVARYQVNYSNAYRDYTEANIPATFEYEGITFTVVGIASRAFEYCRNLTSVTIPATVQSIGENAFYDCSSLTSVTVPNSVTEIGNDAFRYVYNIVYAGAAEGAPWGAYNMNLIMEDPFVFSADRKVLMRCSPAAKGTITVPAGVEEIAENAFSSCDSITSVALPDGLKKIGKYAFQRCSGITSMEIPNSVDTLGYAALSSCYQLETLTIPSTTYVDLYYRDGNYTEKYGLIINLRNLKRVTAPADAFFVTENYYNIIEIMAYTPQGIQEVVVNAGELSDAAFVMLNNSRRSLTSLDLSATSNTVLPMEALKECINLTQVALPAGLIEIGDRSFEDCRHLTSLALPATLKRIGHWAFFQCLQLQNLVVPQGVTEIGDAAFYGCAYLNQVSLPTSVSQIGDYAFANCSKMSKMNVKAVVPPTVSDKTFDEVSLTMPVYVPDASVSAYKADAVWGRLNIIGESSEQSALDNVNGTDAKVRKVIENGHIFILMPDGTRFDAAGKKIK